MVNILACDISIADILCSLDKYKTQKELYAISPIEIAENGYIDINTLPLPQKEAYHALTSHIEELLASHEHKKIGEGQKLQIGNAEFQTLYKLVDAFQPITRECIFPGGSSGNTIDGMCKLLNPENPDAPRNIDANVVTVVGNNGPTDDRILEEYNNAGIHIIPQHLHPRHITDEISPRPESATSFVFTKGSDRTIITYQGNAKDLITPDTITDEMVDKADVILIQGSSVLKFGKPLVDNLLRKRWELDVSGQKHNKEVWLALPTQTIFKDVPVDHFQWIIESSDVIFGNDSELMRVYGKSVAKDTPDYEEKFRAGLIESLKSLQEDMKLRDDHRAREGKPPRLQRDGRTAKPPVAFITAGADGIFVITPATVIDENIKPVPAAQVDWDMIHKNGGILHTLGAGDNAVAGIGAALVAGIAPQHAAKAGAEMGAANLPYPAARMADPWEILHQRSKTFHTSLPALRILEEARETLTNQSAADTGINTKATVANR